MNWSRRGSQRCAVHQKLAFISVQSSARSGTYNWRSRKKVTLSYRVAVENYSCLLSEKFFKKPFSIFLLTNYKQEEKIKDAVYISDFFGEFFLTIFLTLQKQSIHRVVHLFERNILQFECFWLFLKGNLRKKYDEKSFVMGICFLQ